MVDHKVTHDALTTRPTILRTCLTYLQQHTIDVKPQCSNYRTAFDRPVGWHSKLEALTASTWRCCTADSRRKWLLDNHRH